MTPDPATRDAVVRACTYANGTLDCSGRGDGYLWDADGDGYDPSDTTWPCPACNTREYLTDKIDHARGWSSYQFIYTSGAEHWRTAVAVAMEANPVEAMRVRIEIGNVICDDWRDPAAPDPNDMVVVVDSVVAAIESGAPFKDADDGR